MNKPIDIICKNHTWILLLLLLTGFFVRTHKIAEIPGGLNQDEASIGYEAYSLLNFGVDRNGNSFPVFFESWGSGQNALYAYLSIPFVHYFGLNVFSVRLLNSLFGCLSLLLFYSIFRQRFGKSKSLVALAVIVISPWSIMSARWGLESNLFPPIVLLAVFFLIKALYGSPKLLMVAASLLSLSLYSYGTAYLFVPLFVLLVLIYVFVNKLINVKIVAISALLFILISLPILLCILINHFDLESINIGGMTIPKLASNRTTHVFNLLDSNFAYTLVKNIIRFFSIVFLQTDSYDYNSIPLFGTIYHISIPFFIVGLFSIFKHKLFLKSKTHFVFFAWLLSATILGVCIHSNINRINITFIPILYFVVIGFFQLKYFVKAESLQAVRNLLILLYVIYFFFFTGYYTTIFNENIKVKFTDGLGKAIQFAEIKSGVRTVNITDVTVNMPYIYACFYNRVNPIDYQNSVIFESQTNQSFKNVSAFSKYTFGRDNANASVYVLSLDEIRFGNYDGYTKHFFGNYCVIDRDEVNLN